MTIKKTLSNTWRLITVTTLALTMLWLVPATANATRWDRDREALRPSRGRAQVVAVRYDRHQNITEQYTRIFADLRREYPKATIDNHDGWATGVSSLSRCPEGAICVWEKRNFQGRWFVFTPIYEDELPIKILGHLNDNIESYQNFSGVHAFLYPHEYFDGFPVCMPPHTRKYSLGRYNNKASSLYISKKDHNLRDYSFCSWQREYTYDTVYDFVN